MTQCVTDLLCRKASNVMFRQQCAYRTEFQFLTAIRCGRCLQQRPQPWLVRVAAQLQHLRVVAQQQLIKLICGTAQIAQCCFFRATEFAQTND